KRNLVDEARAALAEAETARAAAAPVRSEKILTAPIAVGSPVHIDGVAEPGTLLAIDDRGIADVAAGALRLRVPAAQLRPAAEPDAAIHSDRPIIRGTAPSVPLQLDIRGARAE